MVVGVSYNFGYGCISRNHTFVGSVPDDRTLNSPPTSAPDDSVVSWDVVVH